NVQETPIKSPVQPKIAELEDCITPPPPTNQQQMDVESQDLRNEIRKSTTPVPLKVPKAFKYRSPTDLMVSPVTKGLLARSRRGGAVLPPSMNQINK
ncbi:hypothetical protein Tsubulata_015182, partial [Turnera subulata]